MNKKNKAHSSNSVKSEFKLHLSFCSWMLCWAPVLTVLVYLQFLPNKHCRFHGCHRHSCFILLLPRFFKGLWIVTIRLPSNASLLQKYTTLINTTTSQSITCKENCLAFSRFSALGIILSCFAPWISFPWCPWSLAWASLMLFLLRTETFHFQSAFTRLQAPVCLYVFVYKHI